MAGGAVRQGRDHHPEPPPATNGWSPRTSTNCCRCWHRSRRRWTAPRSWRTSGDIVARGASYQRQLRVAAANDGSLRPWCPRSSENCATGSSGHSADFTQRVRPQLSGALVAELALDARPVGRPGAVHIRVLASRGLSGYRGVGGRCGCDARRVGGPWLTGAAESISPEYARCTCLITIDATTALSPSPGRYRTLLVTARGRIRCGWPASPRRRRRRPARRRRC